MGSQEFCRFCGADTRSSHADDCPFEWLSELEDRVAAVEARLDHEDEVATELLERE